MIIGVGKHSAGSQLPDVPSVAPTVHALVDRLVDRCGMSRDNVAVVLDPADPAAMGEAIVAAAKLATTSFLLYYVGHGVVDGAGALYLATSRTTDLQTGIAGLQALRFADIREALKEHCRASSLVAVLDCCFSQRASGPLATASRDPFDGPAIRGSYLLTATDFNNAALAVDGAPWTTFSGELLRFLDEGDPRFPPELTIEHAYEFLDRALPDHGGPRPQRQTTGRAGSLMLTSNAAFHGVTQETLDGSRDTTIEDICPYPGLKSFDRGDARFFSGRERLTETLLDQLARRLREPRPLLVIGVSGAGKSSLLRAGLLPALEQGKLAVEGSFDWPRLILTPGSDPLSALAEQFVAVDTSASQGAAERASIRDQLERDPSSIVPLIEQILDQRVTAGIQGQARMVLVVDQFEELFTSCEDERQQRAFIAALVAAACPRASDRVDAAALVVLGIRADFYGHCIAFPDLLPAMEDHQVVVGPMSVDEVKSAIEEPAARVGLPLGPGLVELVLRDLGAHGTGDGAGHRPGALPLLSHALQSTWLKNAGASLTVRAYEDIGGIRNAVTRTAEATFQALDATNQTLARRLLMGMVKIGDGTDDVRIRTNRTALFNQTGMPEKAGAVLDALAQARLVTIDEDTAEITHEALLTAWTRLGTWMDDDRLLLRTQQRLELDASEWISSKRDPSRLYRGARLREAGTHLDEARHHIASESVRELIAASTGQEELENSRQRRQTTRLRRLTAALSAFTLLLALAAGFAVDRQRTAQQQGREAVSQRDVARSRQLATDANGLRATRPELAKQLSVLAYKTAQTAEASAALLAAQNTPGEIATGRPTAIKFIPRSRILSISQPDSSPPNEPDISFWDTDGQEVVGSIKVKGVGLSVIDFSPDGRRALLQAIRDDDETYAQSLQYWDVHDLRRPKLLTVMVARQLEVIAASFSADGRLLALGGSAEEGKSTAQLWSVADVNQPIYLASIAQQRGQIQDIAFSPNSKVLATAETTKAPQTAVRLWDVGDPRGPRALSTVVSNTLGGESVAFGSDGRTLVTSFVNQPDVRLWNIVDPRRPRAVGKIAAYNGKLGGFTALSAAEPVLATNGYEDGRTKLWNITDPSHPTAITILAAPPDDGSSLAFSSDGRAFARSTARGVQFWNLTSFRRPGTLATAQSVGETLNSLAFSPDGTGIFTAGYPSVLSAAPLGEMKFTNPDRPTIPVSMHQWHNVGALAHSAHGHSMVTTSLTPSSFRSILTLWETRDRRRPLSRARLDFEGSISSLAMNSHGSRLAAVGIVPKGGPDDPSGEFISAVRLWDIAKPEHPILLDTVAQGNTAGGGFGRAAVSSDGRRLAVSAETTTDGVVLLWGMNDRGKLSPGSPIRIGPLRFTRESYQVMPVAFRPGSNVLANFDDQGAIRLWDVTDIKNVVPLASLNGHSGPGAALSFSSDGNFLVSSAADRTVRLWQTSNVRNPIALGTVGGYSEPPTGVAISPDSRMIGVVSGDQVDLWEMRPGAIVRRLCDGMGTELTRDEWRQYVGSEFSYRSPCR